LPVEVKVEILYGFIVRGDGHTLAAALNEAGGDLGLVLPYV
jgi:hypothetical protein